MEAESVTRKNLRSNAEKFELQAESLDKVRFLSVSDKKVLGEGDDNKLGIQGTSYYKYYDQQPWQTRG